MSDARDAIRGGDLSFIPEESLADFVLPRRWFASKAREVTHLGVLEAVPLDDDDPPLALCLAEARFQAGTHETYQLLVGVCAEDDEVREEDVIARGDGWLAYEALGDPRQARRLLGLMRAGADRRAEEAVASFRWLGGDEQPPEEVRPMGAEQSNTSIVFGDSLVLKAYRRVEPGINPELEILRFLSRREFPHIAPLVGWYEHSGRLVDASLGVLQSYLPGARDGWELALEALEDDPDEFIPEARALGVVTGELHSALGSDAGDPAFAPEEPSAEALALLTATVDEDIEQIFLDVPDEGPAERIFGRGEDVREQLRLLTHVGATGKVIRAHGDYHLGQTLRRPDGSWVVIDFEGEPARALPERRRKRSPLRDVAGMLRSFAYVASATEIMHGTPPPPDWEARAREEFLEGYLESADPALLPPGREGLEKLIAIFELEKAVYELRYELNNRPDWVRIPVAGIMRLLEVPAG